MPMRARLCEAPLRRQTRNGPRLYIRGRGPFVETVKPSSAVKAKQALRPKKGVVCWRKAFEDWRAFACPGAANEIEE
jgi:hypothetical protein